MQTELATSRDASQTASAWSAVIAWGGIRTVSGALAGSVLGGGGASALAGGVKVYSELGEPCQGTT